MKRKESAVAKIIMKESSRVEGKSCGKKKEKVVVRSKNEQGNVVKEL